jgi:hypothetical protein
VAILGLLPIYVSRDGKLVDLPISLPQLMGAHSGENMAEIVHSTLKKFGVTPRTIGYFVLDNAYNNDTAITSLGLMMSFNATYRRLRCAPHTFNLIGQLLLWGKDADSYDNEVSEAVAIEEEHKLMKEWRSDGPLGVLLAVITYIKTLQQYELFERFQRLTYKELPPIAAGEERKILQPVKPVVTRWNSFYSCFERAAELQSAVNAYTNHHIQDFKAREERCALYGNKPPVGQLWMRSNGLTAADWQVITEYMNVLKPLKTATKRLEGRGKGNDKDKDGKDGKAKNGSFGAIAEIILVFEVLLARFEEQLQNYEAVDHNAHGEAPEDHLAINLRAALVKANAYYTKLDDSPAYYAATILHPRYKTFCDSAWAEKPEWISANNPNFNVLWAGYNATPKPRVRPQQATGDLDDAIDSLCNPASAPTDRDEDEYIRWKRCEPVAEKDSASALDPIQYWIGLEDRYPNLSQLALDVLSIPASSCECERMFSELLAAIQCVRRWRRAFQNNTVVGITETELVTDEELELLFNISHWAADNLNTMQFPI